LTAPGVDAAHTGLPASFRPALFNLLVGLVVGVGFVILFAVNYWQRRGAVEAAVLVVLNLFLLALLVELLMCAAIGPVQYVVDSQGLHKGRGNRMKLLFEWPDVQQWTFQSGSRRGSSWRFALPGKSLRVQQHSVAISDSAADFETLVAQVCGKPCTRA